MVTLCGLGSVENLSPYDMPISNATMEAINAIQSKDIGFIGLSDFEVINRLDYDNLVMAGDINTTALYLASRHNVIQVVNPIYQQSSLKINNPGSGYTDGDVVSYTLDDSSLYAELSVNNGVVTEIFTYSVGRSTENFAGMNIPLEGGTGTGLTVDIETVVV